MLATQSDRERHPAPARSPQLAEFVADCYYVGAN